MSGAIATSIVALVLHWLADPVPGVGIAVPVFIPAIVTAVVSLLLCFAGWGDTGTNIAAGADRGTNP